MRYFFVFLLVGLFGCGDDSSENEKGKSTKKKSICECVKEFYNSGGTNGEKEINIKGCEWMNDIPKMSKDVQEEFLNEMKENCPKLWELAKGTETVSTSSSNECGEYTYTTVDGVELPCEGPGCDCAEGRGCDCNN